MLLTRFWAIVLSLALGLSAFALFLAAQMYNHAGAHAMSDALAADSSAVGWFLRDDARTRASTLIQFALSVEIRDGLAKASGDAKIDRPTHDKVKSAVAKLAGELDADSKFDAV